MIDPIFIFGAKYLFILSLFLTGFYFYQVPIENRRRFSIFFLILLPTVYLAGMGARQLYDNPRPFVVGQFEPLIEHEADNGYPSGHVLLVGALAAGFLYFNRRAAFWLWLVAILVAISRIYVGVHHLLDVGASMVIAVACAIIIEKIYGNNKRIQ